MGQTITLVTIVRWFLHPAALEVSESLNFLFECEHLKNITSNGWMK